MKRLFLLASSTLGLALVVACGGSDSKSYSNSKAPANTPAAVISAPQTIELHATDAGQGFVYSPATLNLKPGEVTIKFVNDSQRQHNLTIKSKDGQSELVKSAETDQGQSNTVKFTFTEEGRYEFLCTHTGHSDRGLRSAITVANADGY